MTDEELIARLRGDHPDYLTAAAADRIEALAKERDARPTWQEWKDILAAGYEQKARAERLEAALREIVTCVEDGCFCSEMKMATALGDARDALKGADHE